MEIPSCFVGNSTFAQALHDVAGGSSMIDGIFKFAPALLQCILTQVRQHNLSDEDR